MVHIPYIRPLPLTIFFTLHKFIKAYTYTISDSNSDSDSSNKLHTMGSLSNHERHQDATAVEQSIAEVAVVAVPYPAQGHLNQLLQLSCLISSHGLPTYFVGFAVHNRQAKARVNGLNPNDVGKVHFHDIPTPPIDTPSPDPNATHKFPIQILPTWSATLSMREPVAAYLRDMADKFRRVVVIHDPSIAYAVQDIACIPNAESYAFNCISAISQIHLVWSGQGKPFPFEHPREVPAFEECIPRDILYFLDVQSEPLSYRAGDLYNTCRLIEAPYLEVLERQEATGKDRKSWAIGPILPTILASSNQPERQHKCLEWLDKQEPKSVIYVSFGTTVSLSDNQIKELALGLEQSNVKFLWVLRDADKGDVFDKRVRRAELPEGFEERVEGVGMVVRDWAPQPQILAHPSTGGFMSHCGWNSSMESITMGVPIAAWPMHSDQPMNASFLADILKVGLIVREWTQRLEIVKASSIENVVRRLMASEEGVVIRKRAEETGAKVRQATQPGGASRLELDSFLAHIIRE